MYQYCSRKTHFRLIHYAIRPCLTRGMPPLSSSTMKSLDRKGFDTIRVSHAVDILFDAMADHFAVRHLIVAAMFVSADFGSGGSCLTKLACCPNLAKT